MDNNQSFHQARMSRDARFDGQFFVAVKSTGIFCRPVCPAPSPKEQNVEYFPIAQLAMQAGYRPCLRCRPDSAPNSYAWKGIDSTVERAVRLLKEFPDLSLTEISDKLGISDRYLRTLFERKLGISPKKFQLFEQLLFAKQLLHQSSLSVEEVAQACGFSSSRRLQENLKNNLSLTPTQIRRNSDIKSGTLTLKLSFCPPYNWQHIRDFLATRAIDGMEMVTATSYARTVRLNQCEGRFIATIDQQKHCFNVELQLNDLSQIKNVITQIRRLLDLDAVPNIINTALLKTGLLQNDLIEGIRIPGIWDTFEAGCRAILGQQISVKAAITMVTNLVNTLGCKQQNNIYFPSPQQLLESDLSFLKMPQSRRSTLLAFAQHCNDNPSESQLDKWLSIKGVGPWTVAYAKMRGQSFPDMWLDTDLIIKKQLLAKQLDAQQAEPWRSYLTLQLWSMA
jgi:AraC family transcriptional regulator of adaptative response / DNA-3-methyladenine glycosylase II